MKKADIIIISVLLVFAIGGYGVSQLMFNKSYSAKYIDIFVQNKRTEHILVKDKTFTKTIKIKTELGSNTVEISNDGVRMLDADCHDHICVKEGFKSKAGQTIVCLPNKVVVEIKGEDKTEIDGASY